MAKAMNDKSLKALPIDSLWELYAHTMAPKVAPGRWNVQPHLAYISREVCNAIAAGGARLVIHAPPGHGKSSLISKWVPIWTWETLGPQKIVFATHTDSYARYWGEMIIAELARSTLLQTKLHRAKASAASFFTAEGGEWLAKGVGGAITGRRSDLFIIDDPISTPQDAFSAAFRQQQKDWYDSVVSTRLNPNGSVILLMTRWHEDDLAAYLIGKGFRYIKLSALADVDDPMGRKPGEPLSEEWFPKKVLEKIQKETPAYFYGAMYNGEPTPLTGRIIDIAWLRRWTILPKTMSEIIITGDLNIAEEEGAAFKGQINDFACFEVWGRDGANCYLLDLARDTCGFTDALEMFLRLIRKWPQAKGYYLENRANAPAIQNMLKRKIPGIILVEPGGGKVMRAISCEPMFKAGNVYIPADEKANPFVDAFLDECKSFPGGKHDDQVDPMTIALEHFDEAMKHEIDTYTVGPGGSTQPSRHNIT